MANLRASVTSQVKRTTPYPPGVGNAPDALRIAKRSVPPQVQTAFEATAAALANLQSSGTSAQAALRNPPVIEQILVTDNAGKVIAAIGDFEYQGVVTPNYFSEIHVGDPLSTGNPAQALFNAAGGRVTVGQNGIVEILDPFGSDAAWIGAQADTLPVTGAVNSGSGLIRLTVTAHTLQTGDSVTVLNVGGVSNATGIFTVTSVDANHIDLQKSVFVGAYASGGTVNRVLHVTGAANNGSGLIRITIAAHGYVTGDKVNVVSVGGVPNATGQWIITVISASTFDLQGSTFAGGYTSGGTCLRYFAGMLAQTIAIGPSFQNYKLRAFADGSLKIQNATIDLVSANGEIKLDPSIPMLTVSDAGQNTWASLGVTTEASKAITATTNASPDVVTINAHGYVSGDTLLIAGATGDTAINGYRIVENATTNTFTLTDLNGTAINGNGAYAGGGTATRYYAGMLAQEFSLGSSWASYKLRAFADGSLKIQNATISLTGPSGTIVLDPSTLDIRATDTTGNYVDLIPGRIAVVASGGVADQVTITQDGISFNNKFNLNNISLANDTTSGDASLNIADHTGLAKVVTINTGSATVLNVTGGDINVSGAYRQGGTQGQTANRNTVTAVATVGNAVFGTPGAGQFNSTVVTGVTLFSSGFKGGILTT